MARLDHLGPVKEAAQIRVSDRRARSGEALAHPFSVAIALWNFGALDQLLREPDAAGAIGERIIRYSTEMVLRVDGPGRNVPFRLRAPPTRTNLPRALRTCAALSPAACNGYLGSTTSANFVLLPR